MDRATVERNSLVDPQDVLPADDDRPGALAPFAQFPHTPGYSLWLATAFALGGSLRFIYAQWMQAALDSVACLLAFGIARRLWSTRAGMIGAFAYALSPAHVFLAIQNVSAATDSFWVLLTGYGLVRAWIDREARPFPVVATICVAAGALGGTVMNSMMLVLPMVAAAGAIVLSLAFRPMRRVAVYLLAAQLLVIVVLTPWGLRNERVYGHFTIARQAFWQFTWEALGAVPNPWGLAIGDNDRLYWEWVRANCPTPCTPLVRETFTRDYLLHHVFTSPHFPTHVARLAAKQLPGLLFTSRLPVDRPFLPHDRGEQVLAFFLRILNLLVLLMWPAAAVGLVVTTIRATTRPVVWLGAVPTIFLTAFSVVVMVEHRKTTPAYGYLIALAGIGVAACLEPEAAARH